ncbi:MAG: hypothetical protein QOI07_1238 [Verrucomicrobiota bacterium]|jgi:hypothetical protein
MKTCLLVLCLIATAASSVVAETYRTPAARPRQKQQPKAPPLAPAPVDGVIPRGVRGGNFLQMFNPKAPAKYGTSQEAVVFDAAPMNSVPGQNGQTDAGKWKGIKFFVFRF